MPEPTVLVVNAGSSSLKVALLPTGERVVVERIGADAVVAANFGPVAAVSFEDHGDAFAWVLDVLRSRLPPAGIAGVGHRVVFGGMRHVEPVLVDDAVVRDIEALAGFAPLHNPPNVQALRAGRQLLPDLPHVAVFDTAFHAHMPRRAFLFGLPMRYYRERQIRRYGFHGTSHDYVTRRAAELLGQERAQLRIVSLHLGNGASAAAVAGGHSIDTSMGLTPMDGLLMGTRAGAIDPGVVLSLLRDGNDVDEVDRLLNRESGLLGLSGVSNDMRDVRAASRAGNDDAKAALEVFAYRIRTLIGTYAAAMGGLDVVVFTGGIGENDADIRRESLTGLEFLGIAIDEARNRDGSVRIGAADAAVEVMVIGTDEEHMIAVATRHTAGLT